jgi:uncharacterized protein (DUF2225 family)
MNKTLLTRDIPKDLQGILWSVNVSNLDLKRDKNYITHQILAYGSISQINWLFKIYGKEEVKKQFLKVPQNVYNPSSLFFVKNIILGLKNVSINKEKYVKNILGGVNRPPKKVLPTT